MHSLYVKQNFQNSQSTKRTNKPKNLSQTVIRLELTNTQVSSLVTAFRSELTKTQAPVRTCSHDF